MCKTGDNGIITTAAVGYNALDVLENLLRALNTVIAFEYVEFNDERFSCVWGRGPGLPARPGREG